MEKHNKQTEEKAQAVVNSLKFEFNSLTAALAVLSVMVYYFESKMTKIQGDSAVQIQSLFMLIMLVVLPGIFIWFKNRMKAIQTIENALEKIQRYLKYARIRQYALFLLGLLVLVVQSTRRLEKGYMFIFVVLVMGIFIVPSRSRLFLESGLKDPADKEPTNLNPDDNQFESDDDQSERDDNQSESDDDAK